MELIECSACHRHVRVEARSCPFCGGAPTPFIRRTPRAVGRLTRAAMFYLGATTAAVGCGDDPTPEPESIVQPYGAPPEPPESIAQPYGAAPDPEEEAQEPEEENKPGEEAAQPAPPQTLRERGALLGLLGDSRAAYGGPTPSAPDDGRVHGRVSVVPGEGTSPALDRLLRSRIGPVRACYERELVTSPSTTGRVAVRFSVSRRGEVSDAEVFTNTTGSDAIGSCALGVIRRLRPTAPAAAGTFEYSFSLSVLR